MTYYTGIDVSLRSVSICVVDDKGEVCLEAKVAAEIDAIVDRLHRFSSEVSIDALHRLFPARIGGRVHHYDIPSGWRDLCVRVGIRALAARVWNSG